MSWFVLGLFLEVRLLKNSEAVLKETKFKEVTKFPEAEKNGWEEIEGQCLLWTILQTRKKRKFCHHLLSLSRSFSTHSLMLPVSEKVNLYVWPLKVVIMSLQSDHGRCPAATQTDPQIDRCLLLSLLLSFYSLSKSLCRRCGSQGQADISRDRQFVYLCSVRLQFLLHKWVKYEFCARDRKFH